MTMEKYFDYLDRLRASGVTNMFGAASFLRDEFPELQGDRGRSKVIVKEWMSRYEKGAPSGAVSMQEPDSGQDTKDGRSEA